MNKNKNDGINKITSREENFSQWYLDIIREADLAENSPVRGCMVIKPYGYALWENIQKVLDTEFKKYGTQNAYFPLLIPKSFLEKEAEHVEGFAKECAVVTHHRLEEKGGKLVPAGELDEPLVIRPTSETIIYDAFSRWIHSYRDLPLIINQWCNVVRWEMRPRLFLRTTEFLWQEGHTAHATRKEADEKTLEMLEVYRKFVEEYLAISLVKGKKTEIEKFPGAEYTSTIEAMMQDGKALQSGTSHMLAQNFAKSFDVSFLDENQEKQYVWQTSWGLSTRIIGALIMSHSDDKGLVLPPRIAPIQVVIIPIWSNDDEKKVIFAEVQKIRTELEDVGVTYKVDDREGRPGFKYFEWERKGVPIRIELGPRDIEKGEAVLVRRDTGEKKNVLQKQLADEVKKELEAIQKNLFDRALKFQKENTFETDSWEEFKKIMAGDGGFVKANWCGDSKCELEIKEETKATIRCIPFGEKASGKCIHCDKKAKEKVIFAQAY